MIAVRYKSHNIKAETVLVDLPKSNRVDEDGIYDACFDYITEMIGGEPKWMKIIGYGVVHPLVYPIAPEHLIAPDEMLLIKHEKWLENRLSDINARINNLTEKLTNKTFDKCIEERNWLVKRIKRFHP